MSKGFYVERTNQGRRFVIGDIHGCFRTFQRLLKEQIALQPEDQLFLLGDYINKGPRNREVLDLILHLKQQNYSVYPLIGNHEYFVIRDYEYAKLEHGTVQIRDLIQSKDLLSRDNRIEEHFMDFINALPYYYELDHYLLVHAGLDFDAEEPLEDFSSMIYARGYQVDSAKIGNKTLIHGHTPTGIDKIRYQVENFEITGEINLDNGCVYKNDPSKQHKDLGRLCCLELDRMYLYEQEYVD